MRLLPALLLAGQFYAAAPAELVFKDYALNNGLRVIPSEDHTAPTGPENLQVVAVGDAEKIKTALPKYGPVSLYSSDGQPIPK